MSATLETPNRTDADSTCTRTVKRIVTTAQIQTRVSLTTRFPQNRGEVATILENYGRAAGAIPPAASRAAGAIPQAANRAAGAKNKMISYNRYLRRRTQSNLRT